MHNKLNQITTEKKNAHCDHVQFWLMPRVNPRSHKPRANLRLEQAQLLTELKENTRAITDGQLKVHRDDH